MAAKAKTKRRQRIGGMVDGDVVDWLMKTRGEEKFSVHLNNVLRTAMERETGPQQSLVGFRDTLDNILERVMSLQERVEGIETVSARPPEKRQRGRPRKIQSAEYIKVGGGKNDAHATSYDVRDDIQWYLSHDKYKKIKPVPLVNAFDMVVGKFDTGKNVTVNMLKEGYDQSAIGVPYPTFRLFYFPLIRSRLMDRKIIEKVERPGKKGVYRKR